MAQRPIAAAARPSHGMVSSRRATTTNYVLRGHRAKNVLNFGEQFVLFHALVQADSDTAPAALASIPALGAFTTWLRSVRYAINGEAAGGKIL